MSRIILALFFFVAVASAFPSNPSRSAECPENEEFTSCGSSCPPTCENPKPDFCNEQCTSGCQCTPGFVRNNKKACVPLSKC